MVTLLIVASTLGRDGTSRFITYLANNLTKSNKVKVKLLFFRNISEDSKSMLDDNVEVSCLEVQGKLWSSFYKILNNVLNSKADFCLFGFHQLLWLSLINFVFHLFGIKILLRDTIIPSLFHAGESRLRTIINRIAYRKYDYIIAQSKDMFDDLSTNWRCDKDKMMVINNPVDINSVNNSVGDCPQELLDKHIYTFIAAGRLAYQKGYDIIIERMSEVKSNLNFNLLILGSGELENDLKQLVISKGLSDYVRFIGYQGFPNIVLEANSLGKPVFSNSCKGGINEIIINGSNGLACDFTNKEDFQNGLHEFLGTKFDESKIVELTSSRYSIETIIKKYINFFS